MHNITLGKIRHISNLFALVASLLLLAGCNGALLLPKGEKLYNGAKVKVKKPNKKWDTKALEAALPKAIVLPRRNSRLLGLRPRVSIYNVFHNDKKEKGFRNWVANKLGTEPVLYQASIINSHREAMKNTAANFGFFDIEIKSKEKGILRKRRLKHTVLLHAPAKTIESLNFPADSGALEQRLQQLKSSSLLVPGAHYQLLDLSLERQRLTDSLRNEGWYFLSAENLFFEADTLDMDSNSVRLNLRFKADVTALEKRRYRIGKIVVRPDHNLESEVATGTQEVVIDSCKLFIFKELNLKKKVILDNIRMDCDEYFSNEKYRETLFRLLNLQYFKFVNIRFEMLPGSDSLLVANVLLTPAIPQKVEASISGIFSPSYYIGAQMGMKWLNRNLLGAAEQLSVSWEGNMLNINDPAGDNSLGNYWLFGSDTKAQLTLPQRIPGLRLRQRNALTATRFSLEHQLYYYQIEVDSTTNLGIGLHHLEAKGSFIWKKNRQGTITHELTPIGLSLGFSTFSIPGVKELLFEDIPTDSTGELLVFVTFYEFRPSYVFNYDNRLGKARELSTYFRQGFSLRTNGYQLPDYIAEAANLGRPVNLITESNFNQYLQLDEKTVLAYRIGISAALPLTGESYLYLGDLYTIGGASSVRAFAPRTLGPGSTQEVAATDELDNVRIITSHSGNILLLTGAELRRKFGTSWELAAFVDAGNTWLVQAQSESQQDGVFAFNRFYRELAAGAGLGLRYNLGIFILRLDVAAPIAKPYLPSGSRLVGQRGFGSNALRFNFAFGYPF